MAFKKEMPIKVRMNKPNAMIRKRFLLVLKSFSESLQFF